MSCPRCNSPVDPDARFCASCGEPLHERTAVQRPVAPEARSGTGPGVGSSTGAGTADATDDELLFGGADADDTPDLDRPAAASGAPVSSPAAAPVPESPGPAVARRTAPTADRSTAATTTCPSCGAANSSARMLCGRCGVDLATGEPPAADNSVVQPGPAIDVAGRVDVADGGDGPRTAVLVAIIVVLGALVGIGVGIWAVRAGDDADVATPVFDPAVYPGEPTDLRVGGVGASSTRQPAGETSYGAANMVDGDPVTAWSHDPGSQAAVDVDLAFALDQPAWVTDIIIANGAQADADSFAADARVRTMLLVVDGDQVAELQFRDIDGYQGAELPSPVLAQTIRFGIVEVYEGDTFDEVSISEVSFLGHEAIGADRDRVSG